ncbi:hypothetical protein BA895_22665 [Humibacillus sp. DSM 29435]|uniref:MBL fold metallo-hydrolase n=1 Tax=Humibacillus sp. DSM 29435 TaxID=1869167 RepID=UPI000871E6C3|nr:MBL fold metallo-hydrolase [Humibacillus sp. DSM 29435]OFE15202.1 hypothetical protein BA895_22665 [Humibacillus sp. DSM 29435]
MNSKPLQALDTDVAWIHGSPPGHGRTDPSLQVQTLGPGTVLMRQSKDLTYEAPFLLLLLGRSRALLVDSGAVDGAVLRSTVDHLVASHLAERASGADAPYELVVAHSHAHGDHIAGDDAFRERPHTTVVGTTAPAVGAFFGILNWPSEIGQLELGGRTVDVIAIPGHEESSIAVYDRTTGLLHTGDTLYPGRIYVEDPPALSDSLERLVEFAGTHEVTRLLGAHVEMTTTAGRDYPLGCRYQPDEPSPFMPPHQLQEARDAFRTVAHRTGIHHFDNLIFCVGNGPRVIVPLYARGVMDRARQAARRRYRRPPR